MLNNFKKQYLVWDIANRKIYDKLFVTSGDISGRSLIVQVLNEVEIEDLTGCSLHLVWSSETGSQGMDVFEPMNISKGVFKLVYTDEMLTNVGTLTAALKLITSDSEAIESLNFEIVVKKGITTDSAATDNSFSSLVQALVRVKNIQDEILEWKDDQADEFDNLRTQKAQEFDTMKGNKAEEFDDWFEDIQGVINEDAIGNLNNKIDDVAGEGRTTETVKGNADDLSNHSNKRASLTEHGHVQQGVYSATLEDSDWQSTQAPFTQEISITGLLATDTPVIDVVMSGTYATDEARQEAWGMVYRAVTSVNKLTVYATDKPEVSIPIQLKVVR